MAIEQRAASIDHDYYSMPADKNSCSKDKLQDYKTVAKLPSLQDSLAQQNIAHSIKARAGKNINNLSTKTASKSS